MLGSEVSILASEVLGCGVRSRVVMAGPPDGADAVAFATAIPAWWMTCTNLLCRVGELGRAKAPDMPSYDCADKPKYFSYSVGARQDTAGDHTAAARPDAPDFPVGIFGVMYQRHQSLLRTSSTGSARVSSGITPRGNEAGE
jgi:hypothetical protein